MAMVAFLTIVTGCSNINPHTAAIGVISGVVAASALKAAPTHAATKEERKLAYEACLEAEAAKAARGGGHTRFSTGRFRGVIDGVMRPARAMVGTHTPEGVCARQTGYEPPE